MESLNIDVNNFESKKEQMSERLQKREETRLAELERKKIMEDKTSIKEQVIFFITSFAKAKQQIDEKLSKIENVDKVLLSDYFDNITKDFQSLQKYVADSTFFLPSYDIKIAHQNLKLLQEIIQAKQDEYMPKKKFAFKSKKKIINKGNDHVDSIKKKSVLETVRVDMFECGFKNLSDQTITKDAEEVKGKDVLLYDLVNCTVKIFGSPNTVHMSKIKDCTVLMGPVSTSIFIENCSRCIFIIACQQARIHSTIDSCFYMHVTSKAIIEDCTGIKVAPYNWKYKNIEEDFEIAGLDEQINNWNNIDDFNWLVRGIPSPNWSELSKESRITSWE